MARLLDRLLRRGNAEKSQAKERQAAASEGPAKNFTTLARSLLDEDEKIAVLAGAGVSLDSPSNLLDGWSFMFECLRRACPPETDAMLALSSDELKKDGRWRQSFILSTLDLPQTPFRRPGEMLRFEVLMANLVQSGLDPGLRVLDCLDACDRPNHNHYLLARLIRAGHVVVTTNFDRLIEIAYARLHPGEPLRVVYADKEFPPEGPEHDGPPTLWKIHGSLTVNGLDTRHSVQATMTSILSTSMTKRKGQFFRSVLADFDLWVVGYSGWDDLDVIPVLGNTPSTRRLIWIEHKDVAEPVVRDAEALAKESKAHWEIDAVGRDRIRFTDDPRGVRIRAPENVLVISTPTRRAMDAISETYFGESAPEAVDEDFRFGRDFPLEVQKYFDEWRKGLAHGASAPYEFTAQLFQNLANARDDVRARLEGVYSKRRELMSSPSASPGETLKHLIEVFNDPNDRPPLEELRRRLLALLPSLPPELEGSGLRLNACLTWEIDGPSDGALMFAKAAEVDRRGVRPVQEFATLVTWRGFSGLSQWDDLYVDETSAAAEEDDADAEGAEGYAGSSERPSFSERELRRLHRLVGEIGFFPVLWQQMLATLTHVIDESPEVLEITGRRMLQCQRFSVDLGGVLGEAQTTLILGRMYLLDGQYQLAVEEFLRVIELDRIVNTPWLLGEARRFLRHCADMIGPSYAETIRPFLQESIWGKAAK